MPAPRKFDHDRARELREVGHSYSSIAREMGVSFNAVKRACDPEFRAHVHQLSKQKMMSGTCADCGKTIALYSSSRPDRRGKHCHTCAMRRRTHQNGCEARCTSCGEWKPIGEFYPSSRRKHRTVSNYCKRCDNAKRAMRLRALTSSAN